MIKDQEKCGFSPTPSMKLYAFFRAKEGPKAKDVKVAKLMGIAPETISRFRNVDGFEEWLSEEVAQYSTSINHILEKAALDGIRKGDFRYWQALAEKHGFLTSPEVQSLLRLNYSLD